MTHIRHYSTIVDRIFGTDSCTLDPTSTETTPIIGALSNTTGVTRFQMNFVARLNRLKDAYKGHPSRNSLLTQVNEIGNPKNWQGAAAELAAIDFFCSDQDWLPESPRLDVKIPASKSVAYKFGMKEANIDVHFKHFDVYTDVKVLKDNVTEVIEGIFQEIWKDRRPMVLVEYPRDVSADDVIGHRVALLDHLRTELTACKKPEIVDCASIVNGLIIRLGWKGGVLTAESTYSPYKHAKELHRLPMQHAKKIVLSQPFFLTFVVFPWFNNVITDFCGENRIFYRSLARRTFCQYSSDSTLFSTLFNKYTGTERVHEVMEELGGILFLEDECISNNSSDSTVKAYYYENPNAKRPVMTDIMQDYLFGCVRGDIDDFRYDNY